MYKVNKKHFRAMPKNVALVSFYSLWTFNWCLVYWKNTKIDHIDNAVLFFFHYSLSADFSRCCSVFIIDSELDFACWKDILLMGSFSSKSFAYVLMNEWLSAKFNSLSANPTKWPNTLKQFVGKLPANCLSVFGHFVKLALEGSSLVLLVFLYK